MKPRILFIMHMPPPVHGASMVGKYIHDSETVNSEFDCRYINLTTARSIDDVNRFRVGKIFDLLRLVRRMFSEVRHFRPDLVYFTANSCGMPFYRDYILVRVLKLMRCRITVHYHNKGVASCQNGFINDILYRRFFNGIKVIQLSELLYYDIEKYVRREDVFVCNNGIPALPYRPKEESEPDCKALNILFLSNMMVQKGVWTLLEACRILKDKGLDFCCNFVGGWKDISEDDFNAAIRAYGLEESVFAHGPKYGNGKEEFWNNADIFVLPTAYYNECFPLVLLEAMAHGVACIATDIAAIPSIVDNGSTGFLFHPGDASQLAELIAALYSKGRPYIHALGRNGLEKYKEKYTLDVFERRFTESLKWVMEQ